jgi:23S rRNA (uracil1939-C5)-methyltransferase
MPCVHTHCGGCALLQLSAPEQLARKRAHVSGEFLRHHELTPVQLQDVVAADPAFAYRRRAKLVVSRRGEIGLYARGTHDVVDIPHCLVMTPALMALLAQVRARLVGRPLPLMGIDVRELRSARGQGILVTLIGDARDQETLRLFGRELSELDGVLGVALSVRESRAPQLLGDTPVCIAGAQLAADTLTEGGPYHYATYGAFVQAHRQQAQAVAMRVREHVRAGLGTLEHARVLELYAGSGALGIALAAQQARVVLVERYEPALALAARAAEEQGLRGLATRVGDAEQVLGDLLRARERFDAVVVDPPRRGLTSGVRRAIAQLGPRVVVYVSCDPQTLGRDLADFARLGFSATKAEPFDMMPQSDDVECVVCLHAAAPAPLRVVYEDDELIAVDKPPHMPTIPEAEYPHSLLERLRTQLGADALHAVHRLDVGTSGVCLFTRHSARVAGLAAALAEGQKRYVALARGITHNKGIVKTPLREPGALRDATTRYTRKTVLSGHSLLHVRPEQGRLHQVRRHLAALGHPVLGDARYGDDPSNRHFEHKHGLDRPFLHLGNIQLRHPGSGMALILEAALPGDLQAVLASLKAQVPSSEPTGSG